MQTISFAYFLLGQSPGSEVIDTIGKTTFSHLIECTHEIFKLRNHTCGA